MPCLRTVCLPGSRTLRCSSWSLSLPPGRCYHTRWHHHTNSGKVLLPVLMMRHPTTLCSGASICCLQAALLLLASVQAAACIAHNTLAATLT